MYMFTMSDSFFSAHDGGVFRRASWWQESGDRSFEKDPVLDSFLQVSVANTTTNN
jgi:hypothetical protein